MIHYLCFSIAEDHSSDTLQLSIIASCSDEQEAIALDFPGKRIAVVKVDSGKIFSMENLSKKWQKDIKKDEKQIIVFDLTKNSEEEK